MSDEPSREPPPLARAGPSDIPPSSEQPQPAPSALRTLGLAALVLAVAYLIFAAIVSLVMNLGRWFASLP